MADFGAGITGGLSGAATGFSLGGLWGAAAGGVLGTAAGLFGSKRNKKPKKLSTMDETQQNLYKQYAQGLQGQGPFSDLFAKYDPKQQQEAFKQQYANPAYQNFQENIIPGITGQFRGGNLQNSSYLAGALGKAGTDVQNNLNSHMSQMLQQGQESNLNRRMGALQNIVQQQTFAYQKQQPDAVDQFLGGLSGAGGKAAGKYISNSFMDWMKSAATPATPATPATS